MTTYAIPQAVPDDCNYMTAGKRYRVDRTEFTGFHFYDDEGRYSFATWEESAHLNGGNWTRIEGDEE